ncbi:hypothetical protein [Pseudomonas multiresinivorans]|uniref:Uncharacterized protein n=1 Tax=Pseudomonas multiresinivorans TaxID=95301 RepID=A0A7Z3GRD9_9PSED|nr:hypothetical protein [Pseudomonas multiresinivorans]QJP10008.1 hypothetical protein G4G71_19710 [Pseudomonas multiresinivorans]
MDSLDQPRFNPFSPAASAWAAIVADIILSGDEEHGILWGVGTTWVRHTADGGWLLDERIDATLEEVWDVLVREGKMPDRW